MAALEGELSPGARRNSARHKIAEIAASEQAVRPKCSAAQRVVEWASTDFSVPLGARFSQRSMATQLSQQRAAKVAIAGRRMVRPAPSRDHAGTAVAAAKTRPTASSLGSHALRFVP